MGHGSSEASRTGNTSRWDYPVTAPYGSRWLEGDPEPETEDNTGSRARVSHARLWLAYLDPSRITGPPSPELGPSWDKGHV